MSSAACVDAFYMVFLNAFFKNPAHVLYLHLICSRVKASLHMTWSLINKGIPSETPAALTLMVPHTQVFSLISPHWRHVCVHHVVSPFLLKASQPVLPLHIGSVCSFCLVWLKHVILGWNVHRHWSDQGVVGRCLCVNGRHGVMVHPCTYIPWISMALFIWC